MAAMSRGIRIILSMMSWRGVKHHRHSGAKRSIEPGKFGFRIRRYRSIRNDGDDVRAMKTDSKWQNQQPQSESPQANASAARSPSRSTRRRAGPGTIIPSRRRRAHGAAYATYVGSWRKRFRVTKGKAAITRFEDKATKTVRSFCAHCGTPLVYERPRSPHMVNIPRALFSGRTGRQPLYQSRSRSCRSGPTPASRWCR